MGQIIMDQDANYKPIGIPQIADSITGLVPAGLGQTQSAVQGTPLISTAQGLWEEVKTDYVNLAGTMEDFAKKLYGQTKDIVGTVYHDAGSAVGTVYEDVSSPVSKIVSQTYWGTVLLIVVLAGALYVAGKGGALKNLKVSAI